MSLDNYTKNSTSFFSFQEIDEYIAKAKDQGYHTVLNLGTKGVNYATTVIMQTAIKVSTYFACKRMLFNFVTI